MLFHPIAESYVNYNYLKSKINQNDLMYLKKSQSTKFTPDWLEQLIHQASLLTNKLIIKNGQINIVGTAIKKGVWDKIFTLKERDAIQITTAKICGLYLRYYHMYLNYKPDTSFKEILAQLKKFNDLPETIIIELKKIIYIMINSNSIQII